MWTQERERERERSPKNTGLSPPLGTGSSRCQPRRGRRSAGQTRRRYDRLLGEDAWWTSCPHVACVGQKMVDKPEEDGPKV